MSLELWRNYGTSYIKETGVEVLPVVDLSAESAFGGGGCGRCNAGGTTSLFLSTGAASVPLVADKILTLPATPHFFKK